MIALLGHVPANIKSLRWSVAKIMGRRPGDSGSRLFDVSRTAGARGVDCQDAWSSGQLQQSSIYCATVNRALARATVSVKAMVCDPPEVIDLDTVVLHGPWGIEGMGSYLLVQSLAQQGSGSPLVVHR